MVLVVVFLCPISVRAFIAPITVSLSVLKQRTIPLKPSNSMSLKLTPGRARSSASRTCASVIFPSPNTLKTMYLNLGRLFATTKR